MGRVIAAIALVALLVVGGGIIATTAYQAGLSTAVTTAVTDTGATVVTSPIVPYAYPGYGYGPHWGWGGGPGFGFFGFLGTLLFIFLIFGLLRAVFGGRGRGWGGPGSGPGGRGGWGGPGYDRWQGRAKEVFDDFHKDAHSGNPATSAGAGQQPPSA